MAACEDLREMNRRQGSSNEIGNLWTVTVGKPSGVLASGFSTVVRDEQQEGIVVFFFPKKFECSQFCGLWEAGEIYF